MTASASRITVLVDRDLCMGSGTCVMYAPLTFAHDDETKAVVAESPGDAIDYIHVAVEACPTGALTLLEVDTEA